MKHSIDSKIRERLIENDVSVPETCQKRMEDTVKGLPEIQTKRYRLHFKVKVAISIVCLLISSITVIAAVDYVKQRMKSLTEEEKNNYYEGLQDSTANADSYSRELTNDERNRMDELRVRYENGTFPANKITIVDTKNHADENAEFYFVEDESLFVLPSRELTEEEMLEMIDFYYCRDYSLTEKAQENSVINHQDDDIENGETNGEIDGEIDGKIEEDKVVELAKTAVEDIYGIDIAEYAVTVCYNNVEEYENFYSVEMKDNNTESSYIITIDDNQKIQSIMNNDKNTYSADKIKVDQGKFIAKYEDALNIVTTKMYTDMPVVQSTCEYNYNSEGCLGYGVVNYLFKFEDGMGCIMQYSCSTDTFYNIFMTNYDKYREVMDKNRKKKGLEREVIQMQP